MYQMIWSGLTKYLNSMIHDHSKAVEIPGLIIFGPLIEQWATFRDPLSKGPISKSTYSFKESPYLRTVIAALNEDFVK